MADTTGHGILDRGSASMLFLPPGMVLDVEPVATKRCYPASSRGIQLGTREYVGQGVVVCQHSELSTIQVVMQLTADGQLQGKEFQRMCRVILL